MTGKNLDVEANFHVSCNAVAHSICSAYKLRIDWATICILYDVATSGDSGKQKRGLHRCGCSPLYFASRRKTEDGRKESI